MASAVCIWSGGTNVPTQMALRRDGIVFKRYKARDKFGFNWTRWSKTFKRIEITREFRPDSCISTGVAILSLVKAKPGELPPRVQLPND